MAQIQNHSQGVRPTTISFVCGKAYFGIRKVDVNEELNINKGELPHYLSQLKKYFIDDR
jgi:hypothetical protein